MAEWKLVPVEPTPEMIAAAVGAVLPPPHPDDFKLARSAARLILMDPRTPPGCTVEGLAAAMATIIPAHRAMLAAAPLATAAGGWCTHCGCGNDAAGYAHLPNCIAAHGVAACRPAADKITIRHERAGRCFWHIGCTAQHHAPPMRVGQDDAEKRRTAIHCTACNEAGYYPHGSVGEVCCERVTDGVGVPQTPKEN